MKTLALFPRILATTALFLAAVGVSCCVGICSQATFSGNGGAGETTGAAWLYIDEVSTSEDVYEDGSTFVVEELRARLVYEEEDRTIKIHNYHPAHVGNFRKGECYLLLRLDNREKLNSNGVILIDEILQLCPIGMKN